MFIFATLKQKVNTRWLGLIFVWAFIPSYAQVYVGVHFPTDIIGGIIAGLVIGYLVAYLFKRIAIKANVIT
jgi:undecaprenyl-diphosphatase